MGALISPCGKYRTFLERVLPCGSVEHKTLLFVMLNPSTADAELDDPTIRKCKGFCQRLGYSKLQVVNLFDYRATDPKELKTATPRACSEWNAGTIQSAAEKADMIICAWGVTGTLFNQNERVLSWLKNHDLYALEITKNGHPKHPLYISYDRQPVLLRSKQND